MTHAQQLQQNIILAELSMFGNVFDHIERLDDGTVIARTINGNLHHLQWCVTHQRIETIAMLVNEPIVVEIAA